MTETENNFSSTATAVKPSRWPDGLTRGYSKTPEYRVWVGMKSRCQYKENASFEYYGQRGIKVCERWLNFSNFLSDMGKRPSPEFSIERKNNDGDYEPDNCVWATQSQQHNNSRRNVRLTFNGKTLTVWQWAEEIKVSQRTLWMRIFDSKWTIEKALTTPVDKAKSKAGTISARLKLNSNYIGKPA